MPKWLLIISAMKPVRVIGSHLSFWLGIVWSLAYFRTVTLVQLVEIAVFIYFYGTMYLINDIADIKRDLADIVNNDRPIVTGKISVKEVAFVIFFNLMVTFAAMFFLNPTVVIYMVALLVINVVYSFVLKNFAYIDLVWISLVQCFKLLIAITIMSPVLIQSFSIYYPIMALLFLISIEFHVDKQRGKLAYGMKRKYFLGKCTDQGLLVMQRITTVILFMTMTYYIKYPMIVLVAVPTLIADVLRLVFPALSTTYLFKAEGLMKKMKIK